MTDRRQPAPVMVPVLVTFSGTAEVMVDARYLDGERRPYSSAEPVIRTALAYITPEGFTVEDVEDWEPLPR